MEESEFNKILDRNRKRTTPVDDCYIDDVVSPEFLHASAVRSSVGCGSLQSVSLSVPADEQESMKLLTSDSLEEFGVSEFLVDDWIHRAGQPLGVLICEMPAQIPRGLSEVEVQLDADSPLTRLDPAIERGRGGEFVRPDLATHTDDVNGNTFGEFERTVGEPYAQLQKSDHVITETISNARVSQVPMEPIGTIANYDSGTERVHVHTNSQQTTVVRDALVRLFDENVEDITVTCPQAIGGAFGVKQALQPHHVWTVVASIRTGRPVKTVFSREEMFTATGSRQRHRHEVKVGVSSDGQIDAIVDRVTADSGSEPTGARAVEIFSHYLAPPYDISHIGVRGEAVLTNTIPDFPYRGYGMTRGVTAREVVLDLVAETLDIDPVELRRTNLIKDSMSPQRHPSGQQIGSCSVRECLNRVISEIKEPVTEHNHGLGVAVGMEKSSTETEWQTDVSSARAELRTDGSIVIASDLCPIGTGTREMLTTVVTDLIPIDNERVSFVFGDTGIIDRGGGTAKSRSVSLGAVAVRRATDELIDQLQETIFPSGNTNREVSSIGSGTVCFSESREFSLDLFDTEPSQIDSTGPECVFSATAEFENPCEGNYEGPDGSELGDTAVSYPFTAHAVVVEVDPNTGSVSLEQYVTCDDIGSILDQHNATEQVRGGVVQGVSAALGESVEYDDEGKLEVTDLHQYSLPTAESHPKVDRIQFTNSEANNTDPSCAKAVAENGAVVAPAAVLNAVNDAIDGQITRLPATPERVLEQMEGGSW